jgi:hypothetical protein
MKYARAACIIAAELMFRRRFPGSTASNRYSMRGEASESVASGRQPGNVKHYLDRVTLQAQWDAP